MEACKYSEFFVALKDFSCFSQNLQAFEEENQCKGEQQVQAGQPRPEQLLRVWKCAARERLIPSLFRRMQTTWSPDQTAGSSRLTPSRNSPFFSSSKVSLIFLLLLPDEATGGPLTHPSASSASVRLSSRCPADDADPHLPAGDPGPGEPGGAAGRPGHLHGQVHREPVQPDGLLVRHDDR